MLRYLLQLAIEWYCFKCGKYLGSTQGGAGRAEVVCAECAK